MQEGTERIYTLNVSPLREESERLISREERQHAVHGINGMEGIKCKWKMEMQYSVYKRYGSAWNGDGRC